MSKWCVGVGGGVVIVISVKWIMYVYEWMMREWRIDDTGTYW